MGSTTTGNQQHLLASTSKTFMTSPPPEDPKAAGTTAKDPPSLSRREVLLRRSLRAKQQIRFLKECQWALLEDLRVRLRDYYWKYGVSPQDIDDNNYNGDGAGASSWGGGIKRKKTMETKEVAVRVCAFPGCKAKPMELTNYCHHHILSDTQQTLYKSCTHVIKSGATGPVLCWKPVLCSAVPSLCPIHFQKAQKHVSQALKKAGLNLPSSSRPAPKFHVIIAEYVQQIKTKRKEAKRAALDGNKNKGKNIG